MPLLRELASAARQLLRRPLLALGAVLPLAVAIAALTTLFAVYNGLLLRPMPGMAHGDRLLEIGRGARMTTLPHPVFRDLESQATTLDGVFGWTLLPGNLRADGAAGAERAAGMMVSGNYFEVVGARAAAGRLLSAADDAPSAGPVAVLSHAAFQRFLGGDASRIGGTLSINGLPMTVVGVADRGFHGHVAALAPAFYVPLRLQPRLSPGPQGNDDLLSARHASWLQLGARRAPGVDDAAVAAELAAIGARLQALMPTEASPLDLRAEPLRALPRLLALPLSAFTALLLALVAVVLLVACNNVAGLLLAHGEARAGELAVRSALGAGRSRLFGMLFAEALLLAGAAVALALALAQGALLLLARVELPSPVPLDFDLPMDFAVLGFALAAGALATLAAGLAPALRLSRAALAGPLAGRATRRSRLRDLLVVGQVSMTLLLLVGAGLLLHALHKAAAIDPGFDPQAALTADFDLGPTGYDAARREMLVDALLARVRAMPGVESAGVAALVPLTLNEMVLGDVALDGLPQPLPVPVNVVSPGYLEALGIRVDGRDFGVADGAGADRVVIINRSLARRLFGDGPALDRSFDYGVEGARERLRVVGVVPDARFTSLAADPGPFLYLPLAQQSMSQLNLFVRTARPAGEFERALVEALRELDPLLPAPRVHPMADVAALSLLPQRIAGGVAGALGALGLLLAALGLYALVAQHVAARTREIGVRLSLGAAPARIAREVAGRGARLLAVGAALGLLLALGLARLAEGALFGVQAGDGLAFAAALGLLGAIGLAACLGPARRAARIEPSVALRHD